MGKDHTVRFVFDSDKGLRSMEKVLASINSMDLSTRESQKQYERMVVELEKVGKTYDTSSEKAVKGTEKQIGVLAKLKKGVDEFNEGVAKGDARVNTFMGSLFKIGRAAFKLYLTFKFIKKLIGEGFFSGMGNSIMSAFSPALAKKFFGGAEATPLKTMLASRVGMIKQAFDGVFARSTLEGASSKLFKNVQEIFQGKRAGKQVFGGVGAQLKTDIESVYPVAGKLMGKLLGLKDAVNMQRARFQLWRSGEKTHTTRGGDSISPVRRATMWWTEKGPWTRAGQGMKYTWKGVSGISKALGGMNNSFGDMWSWMTKLFTAPLKLIAIVWVFMKLKDVLKKTIEVGLETEKYMQKMQIMLGSEKGAVKMYKEAIASSLTSKYKPSEVAESASMMTSYRIRNPFEKGAYGMDKGTDVMNVAYGMAAAGGEGLQNATMALMRADVALLDKYTAAREVYNKLIAKGMKLGTDEFRKAFILEVSKVPEYVRAAKIESEGVAGAWSTIQGATEMMWVAFSGASEDSEKTLSFWNSIKRILNHYKETAVAFAEFMSPILSDLGGVIGEILEVVYNVYKLIQPFLGFVLAVIMKALHVVIIIAGWVLKIVNWFLNGVYKGMMLLFKKIGEFLKWVDGQLGITDKVKMLVTWISDVALAAGMIWQGLSIYFNEEIKVLKALFGWLVEAIKAAAKGISYLLDLAQEKLEKLMNDFQKSEFGRWAMRKLNFSGYGDAAQGSIDMMRTSADRWLQMLGKENDVKKKQNIVDNMSKLATKFEGYAKKEIDGAVRDATLEMVKKLRAGIKKSGLTPTPVNKTEVHNSGGNRNTKVTVVPGSRTIDPFDQSGGTKTVQHPQ